VSGRNDLKGFIADGIANNDWPAPSNLNSLGVMYVSDGSLSGSAAYRTPAEWAQFSTQVSGDVFENLKITDLDSTFAPPLTSLAAINGIPVAGVYADLYGALRPIVAWTDGAVQIIQSVSSSTATKISSKSKVVVKPVKPVKRSPPPPPPVKRIVEVKKVEQVKMIVKIVSKPAPTAKKPSKK
jgi:hypothetical protein